MHVDNIHSVLIESAIKDVLEYRSRLVFRIVIQNASRNLRRN
jgi:hypothetical protein